MDREPHLYNNDSYEDITADLKSCAASMKVGDIIKVPGFKLFDAINAFEMGSEKMDTGIKYRSLETDMAKVPSVETAQDFVDLADVIVGTEMSWHQGNMPLRTIFCCLPLEDMATKLTDLASPNFKVSASETKDIIDFLQSKLEVLSWQDVASIYILATIKVCQMTMALIETEPTIVSIEDEFHVAHGGYYMLEHTPVDLITRLLDAAMRFAKTDKPAAARLQLKSSWLLVVKQRFAKKSTHIDKVLDALQVYDDKDFAKENRFSAVLSDGVQSRASSFSLAQPLEVMTLEDAVRQWIKMAEALKSMARVLQLERSADLMGFFLVFSSQNHLPFVRISLKTVVSDGDILGQNVRTWITKDVRELSCPDWDPTRNKSIYEPFIAEASRAYVDLLTTFLLNRELQRESLVGLVTQYDSLQVTADAVDEAATEQGLGRQLTTGNGTKMWALELSSAVQLRKLQVMLWVVLLTLELEIALPWEYGYVYWYGTQLGQRLLDQLARLKAYFEQHGMRDSESGYAYLVALELEARALTQTCSAEYLVHVALQKRGLVSQPKSPLTSIEFQYGLRFQMFQSVGVPPMATLAEYQRIYDKLDFDLALEAARNSISGARSLLKTLMRVTQENEDMRLISRSCVGLQLAILDIEKADPGKKLAYDREGYHRYFPVVKISK